MTDDLTGYAELADVIDKLPLLIREARRARKLALRPAADEIGTSAPTLHRFETRRVCKYALVPDLLRWLGQPVAQTEHGG